MKRLIFLVLGASVTLTASAQSWQDALYFSENNYLGTARGVGMGNALTAIGGDPGSLTFNPAGAAVAGYSQITVTPGFSLSSTLASGVVPPGASQAVGFGNPVRTSYMRMKLPNAGVTLNLETGRRSGIKRVTIGFVANATGDYTGRLNASGVNIDNSYAAALATSAGGYTEAQLGTSSWWDEGPRWVDMVGYRSGMFNGIPGSEKKYQAVTEVRNSSGDIRLAGPLNQRYGLQTTGYKQDMIFNLSANYEDRFYFGANLGLVTLNYAMAEYWEESPQTPSLFPEIEYTDGTGGIFNSLQMKHSYRLRGTGVYAKAGLLWRPAGGLRLGFAIQTPTATTFDARQAYSGKVEMTGKTLPASTSPEDNWTYRMTQPWRLNLGAAYSFGSVAVLSADYELSDFGSIRYNGTDGFLPSYLEEVNLDVTDALGVSHQLRVGAEVKPLPFLSVRAGYNLVTSPQKNWLTADWKVEPLTSEEKRALSKHSASLGLGASIGAFFVDAAVRVRFMPKEYILVYEYVNEDILTPEIEVTSRCWNALLTLGWRF